MCISHFPPLLFDGHDISFYSSAAVVSAADSWDQRPLWSVSCLWWTCHHFHVALMPFPWFHGFFHEISISSHSLIYDFDPPLIPHSVYTLVLNPIIKWKHAWSNSIIHFQNCCSYSSYFGVTHRC